MEPKLRRLKIQDRVEMNRSQVAKKWSGRSGVALAYTPDAASLTQAGYPIFALKLLCRGLVCEVGCGPGRMSKVFPANSYIGIDINPDAITEAKSRNPKHKFQSITWDQEYPQADTYLFHTVMFHIPDEEIESVISRCSRRVIVSESMIGWIRDYGKGFNFHRDPSVYRKLFEAQGWEEKELIHFAINTHPYFANFMVFDKVAK